MMRPRYLLASLSALLLLGCSGAPAPATSSASTNGASTSDQAERNNAAPAARGSAEAAKGPPSGQAAAPAGANPPAPPATPVLAAGSSPPGVQPLSAAEEGELKDNCGGLIKHLRKVSAQDSGSRARLERIHQLLDNPPSLPGTDVPRCGKLLQRSVVDYRAQTIESEGINGLKRILVGLSMAMGAAQSRLCPSATSVPAQLESLGRGPQQVKATAWAQPGWQCVRFNLQGAPQHFQYELRSNASAGSYQIMARGYPVDGQAPVELFINGTVKDGAIELSSDIYRRAMPQ